MNNFIDLSELKNLDDWLIENEDKDIKELNKLIKGKTLYYYDKTVNSIEEFKAENFKEDDWFIYGINDNDISGYPPECCYFE